jgi:hypothetical protein
MDIRDRWISLLHRTATGSKKMRTLLTPKRKTPIFIPKMSPKK